MKTNYDFSRARRGAVLAAPPGKVRITIRLDREIIEWFKTQVEAAGGGNYQTLMNNALHEYTVEKRQPLENILRRVVREELQAVH